MNDGLSGDSTWEGVDALYDFAVTDDYSGPSDFVVPFSSIAFRKMMGDVAARFTDKIIEDWSKPSPFYKYLKPQVYR